MVHCEQCKVSLNVIDFIKSDGTTNRLHDRIIAQCPKCKTVINTKYDPRDWWIDHQLTVIERHGGEIID